jgi:hypothetical protein
MEKQIFKWNTLEYKEKNRSVDWYWAVGIITIAIVVIAIFLQNFLFAVLILISVGTLMMFAIRSPKVMECTVNERGIILEKYLHPYSELEAFWISNSESEPKLILKSKKQIMPLTIISIEEVDPSELRVYMLNFLDEKEMEEPLPHKIMDFLGF